MNVSRLPPNQSLHWPQPEAASRACSVLNMIKCNFIGFQIVEVMKLRFGWTYALFILSTGVLATEVIVDGQKIGIDPKSADTFGFCVAVEAFDPIIDEYSVTVTAQPMYGNKTFSHYYVSRFGSLTIEVKPEQENQMHLITLFVPEAGFDNGEVEITATYIGPDDVSTFFNIELGEFLPLAVPFDESGRCGVPRRIAATSASRR